MMPLVLLTLVLGGALLGINWIADDWVHPYVWWIVSFLFLINLIGHWMVQKGMGRNKENFMSFYLGGMAFRFLVSVIFIGIFIYKRVPDLLIFVINFFVLYLLYLGFEIWGVLGNLRRDSHRAG